MLLFQFHLLSMRTPRYLTELLCSNFWLFIWIFKASAFFVIVDRSKNKSCDLSMFSVSLFAFSQFVTLTTVRKDNANVDDEAK